MSDPALDMTPAPAPVITTRPINRENPHIVILGGGFGGIQFAKSLGQSKARVTLVDRQNHHTFQPLLYQVATASLSVEDIAQPIRGILAGYPNVSVIQGEAKGIDLNARVVAIADQSLEYDYLVVALGGVTGYFGHNEWEQFAPGLKCINDAVRIRHEILSSLEKAEQTLDEAERKRLMTVVVVGGGPTGVEMAGAVKELGRYILKNNFRRIKPEELHVILIEAVGKVLGPLDSPVLSKSAVHQLEEIGVEVRLNTLVKDIQKNKVILGDEVISTGCIVWSAGVGANPITRTMGTELDRAGRIKVNPDLSIPGHPEAFAIGDIISLLQENGAPVPGVSPAAIQTGHHVAKIIASEIEDATLTYEQRPKFKYWDKGSMAIIGQGKAVLKLGKFYLPLGGVGSSIAWLMWLLVHWVYLTGISPRWTVAIKWLWSILTNTRYARCITLNEPTEIASGAPVVNNK